LFQMNTGNFFLAFDDELDSAGKLAALCKNRVDREQAVDKMPLVVADAASKQFSIPQHRLERRAFPQLERFGRLDIVVIIEEEGIVGASLSLGKNDWRATGRDDFHFKTALFEHFGDQTSSFFQAPFLGGN